MQNSDTGCTYWVLLFQMKFKARAGRTGHRTMQTPHVGLAFPHVRCTKKRHRAGIQLHHEIRQESSFVDMNRAPPKK